MKRQYNKWKYHGLQANEALIKRKKEKEKKKGNKEKKKEKKKGEVMNVDS